MIYKKLVNTENFILQLHFEVDDAKKRQGGCMSIYYTNSFCKCTKKTQMQKQGFKKMEIDLILCVFSTKGLRLPSSPIDFLPEIV